MLIDTDMLPYRTRWVHRFARLEELLEHGEFQPPLLHYFLLFFLPTIGAIMVRRRSTPYNLQLRRLIFIWTAGFGMWIVQTCRTPSVGNGYGIGIFVSAFVMRSGSMILIRDPEREFRRIVKTYAPQSNTKVQTTVSTIGLRSSNTSLDTTGNDHIYIWQDYPQQFWPRLGWVMSLLFCLRGSVWNWRAKTSRPLPEPLLKEMQKDRPQPVKMKSLTSQSRLNSNDHIWKAIRVLTKHLLWMTLLFVIAQNDPYFWGELQAGGKFPRVWPFRSSSTSIRVYRFLVLIYLLKAIGEVMHSFWALSRVASAIICTQFVPPEDWMITDMYGPHSALCDYGIIGFWGVFWHQILRFDFLTWSRWTLSFLPVRFQKAQAVRHFIYLIVPFTLSGIVHACGSYTQFNDSNGVRGTVIHWLVQPVGIGLQRVLSTVVLARLPPNIHKTALFITTLAWGAITGPAILNGPLHGGLLASIFITPFTGWKGDVSSQHLPFMGIWRGKNWWQSGIRIL